MVAQSGAEYWKATIQDQKVKLFGITFTSDGNKLKNEKVHAINKMSWPTNIKNVQCNVDMVNYLNKYSPYFAELGDILHELTK